MNLNRIDQSITMIMLKAEEISTINTTTTLGIQNFTTPFVPYLFGSLSSPNSKSKYRIKSKYISSYHH